MSTLAITKRRLPVGTIILLVLMAVGLVAWIYRMVLGLGAATNLTDYYPWGLWIGFDVLSGVPLAAGAFSLAAVVYIFNLEKYRPIVRPALLTGFLGYGLVALGVFTDLGRPYQIFNFMLPWMWNIHSVLLEVGLCVMLYLTVLALEMLPPVFERFHWQKSLPARILHAATIPLVILGITLSTMHQSSLGSLYLATPSKLHPLWFSPLLPLLFYVQAIVTGLAMVIVESNLSARAFRRGLEQNLLAGLGRAIPFILGLYLALKLGDLIVAGDFGRMFEGSLASNMYLVELVVGALLPIVLFALPKVRHSPAGLFWSAALVIAGLVLSRLNVSLLGLTVPAGETYFPHWMELAVTIAFVSGGVFAFMLAVRFLPIFPALDKKAH